MRRIEPEEKANESRGFNESFAEMPTSRENMRAAASRNERKYDLRG
jgi:hypothetical protein